MSLLRPKPPMEFHQSPIQQPVSTAPFCRFSKHPRKTLDYCPWRFCRRQNTAVINAPAASRGGGRIQNPGVGFSWACGPPEDDEERKPTLTRRRRENPFPDFFSPYPLRLERAERTGVNMPDSSLSCPGKGAGHPIHREYRPHHCRDPTSGRKRRYQPASPAD